MPGKEGIGDERTRKPRLGFDDRTEIERERSRSRDRARYSTSRTGDRFRKMQKQGKVTTGTRRGLALGTLPRQLRCVALGHPYGYAASHHRVGCPLLTSASHARREREEVVCGRWAGQMVGGYMYGRIDPLR